MGIPTLLKQGNKMNRKLNEPPTETQHLAVKIAKKIDETLKKEKGYHERIKHNRDYVLGLDFTKDKDVVKHRANLLHSTISAMLPQVYAKNPEVSITHRKKEWELMTETIEKVLGLQFEAAALKNNAKRAVRSAMTTSRGIFKVTYQKDYKTDPLIEQRINDTQENIAKLENVLSQSEEANASDEALRLEELKLQLEALNQEVEVEVQEGLRIDRVLTENLLIDPSVVDFDDYVYASWMAQRITMSKVVAEGLYGYKLDKAVKYKNNTKTNEASDDDQVVIWEYWDKTNNHVYTIAEGCQWWLREPYSPENLGDRWYPFFIIPFQLVDGKMIAPSLVELCEKLQDEHNTARDRFNDHRNLCIPKYLASGQIKEKDITSFSLSGVGEIVVINDDSGRPLNQVFDVARHPPIDPMVYTTDQARYDWEMVTGLQDASRSTVVKPKTATEAGIMERALSGRVSEFRDAIEDVLTDMAKYAVQILLLTLDKSHITEMLGEQIQVLETGEEKLLWDWPQMSREEVADQINIKVRAGTTGMPNKLEQQDKWLQLLGVMQPIIQMIMQMEAQGMDSSSLRNIFKHTLAVFDDSLDSEDFLPKKMPQQMPQQMPMQ